MLNKELCIRCKGKLLCGLRSCPLYDRIRSFRDISLRKEVEAPSPPHYQISWKNYPRVAVGPNLSLQGLRENPYGMKLEEFVAFTANQLRTYQMKGIRTSEETALSVKPVNFDVKIKSVFGGGTEPGGMIAAAEEIVPDEVNVPSKVYSLVDSFDLKAQEALMKIRDYGFDYMVQALSTGNLGIPTERKLVPTRWAITAVDSALAKDSFEKIRSAPQIEDFELYRNSHWDNHFLVVLAPWGWAFEMLERWYDGKIIGDGEYGRMKKDYASNITGAYYSARLEVLEKLVERKKCAACIVMRQIGDKYIYPVGVWHVREAVKEAMQNPPEKFGSLAELESRLGGLNDFANWKSRSELWKVISTQTKLSQFT
jgi:hypothetical protein